MPETPKNIRVLLLAVAVVVLLAVGTLVGVIVAQLAQTGDTSRPTIAGTPEESRSETPLPVKTPVRALVRRDVSRISQIKTPRQIDLSIESPEAPPEPRISLLGSGRGMIVTSSGGGKMHIEIAPGMVHGKSGNVSMLRAARLVKAMDLSETQKAAVAKFDEMFQDNITQRIEHDEQAVKDVARGLEDAYRSGDKQLISMAQEQAMEIAKYQAKATDQLNEQYADGVRQYLNSAQEAKLDQDLEQKTPAVLGYMTVRKDDGTIDVRVLQPNVPPGSNDDNK